MPQHSLQAGPVVKAVMQSSPCKAVSSYLVQLLALLLQLRLGGLQLSQHTLMLLQVHLLVALLQVCRSPLPALCNLLCLHTLR